MILFKKNIKITDRFNSKYPFIILVVFFSIVISSINVAQVKDKSNIEIINTQSNTLNDIAKFTSGVSGISNKRLLRLSKTRKYRAYKRSIDWYWKRFYSKKIKKIEQWRKRVMPANNSETIFYPFSGPDIVNALAFYPHAKEYIMIGLEWPGTVPRPQKLSYWQNIRRLWQLKHSMRTLLSINYFRTREMWKDIRRYSFSSITGVMMFFLTRYNYEIIDIKKITVNRKGLIQERMGKFGILGMEIRFKKRNSNSIQIARYFKVDLSDKALRKNVNFVRFLGKKRTFSNLTKAASYLLSYKNFNIIRTYILNRSEYIVQSDCGIPYRYFKKHKWDINLYGRYVVLKMFIRLGRYQRDLAWALRKNAKGRLPFSFGYGYTPWRSNLLLAIKKN